MGVILAGLCLCAAVQAQPADALKRIHEAMFSSFIPVDEVADKPELGKTFQHVRDEIWRAASQAPAFRSLLDPFADLRGFGSACGVADYLKTAQQSSFDQLSAAQRARVLYLLQSCAANPPRRLAMNLRNFYLRQTYGPLQESLTGIKLKLFAPDQYVRDHRPKLPKTRLRYDRDKKEIAHQDGAVDYLIVGSGPSGAVLAHELRRGGKRVVVLERGSFTVPGAMETRLVDELKESSGTRTSADGGIFIRAGMAVGGGSLVNVDLCFAPTLPTVQARIAAWRRDGRIAANDFARADLASAYEWVKTAIGTRVLSEAEINPNNRTLWDGAKRAGLHPKLYDLNTYAPGTSPFPVTDKRSAAEQLILKALQDENNALSLISDADVRRIIFDDRRTAVGVEARIQAPFDNPGVLKDPNGLGLAPGDAVTVRARNVILAAGALGSAAILLRSKIGNDQIGRGVVLHTSMPVLGRFDRTIDALEGTQASVFVDDALISEGYALEAMSAEPLYAAVMSPGSARRSLDMIMSYRNLAGFGVMLVDTPSPNNRIVLDDSGEPVVQYELSSPDKQRFRRGVTQAARVMFLAGAKAVYLPSTEELLPGSNGELRPVVFSNISQVEPALAKLQFIPNRTMVTSAHMQATNKMGSSPHNSVVSRDFRVWDTEHLYVVDSSVFPTSVGANPMQTIYTMAKLFADRLTR